MSADYSKDDLIQDMAKLIAGVAVPVSIVGARTALGVGHEAWNNLYALGSGGFGWTTPEKIEEGIRKVLEDG